MAQYKWRNAQEWLEDRLNRLADEDDMNAILSFAIDLVRQVDNDILQDLYQQEMTDAGFFIPSDAVMCPECGDSFVKSEMADPETHLSIGREMICMECHKYWLQIDGSKCRGCTGESNE